ncbi:MAG TPA: prenyltransferase [Polyangiaceae bacterium]|jgi:1,4-dihydroxy-2-naphthoate octaprenyltransferase|nr:prenyltransferase [Polyangiaceae bacterium]
MTRLGAWVQASRPLAQISIAVPLVYGQALAFAAYGTFAWKLFAAVHLFGLMDQLFVVYTNDVADFVSDAHNTTYNRYSGGSRVIAEGKLAPIDLAGAATVSLFGMAAVAAYLVFREHRAFMVVIAAIGAHLVWVYSFPPFRLSYRGFGEWLQGIGLGVLLPVAGFYAQAGTLTGLSPFTLLPGFLLGYAGHVVAALADAPSDAASSKRTLAVRRGEPRARRTVIVVVAAAIFATPLAVPRASVVVWLAAMAIAGATLYRNSKLEGGADSIDHVRCERFTGAMLGTIAVVILTWSFALTVTHFAA